MAHDTGHRLVFVDDDPQEAETFLRLYGSGGTTITTVVASTPEDGLAQVVAALGDTVPDLFVLDMYFPVRRDAPGGIDELPAHEAEALRERLRALREDLDALAGRLETDPGDGKGLLRAAQAVAHGARAQVDAWCRVLDQSPAGGIHLLQLLSEKWPAVPKVFYSRKATLDDAKQALAAGALDVVLKPEPSEEARKREAIAGAFSEYCQALPPDYLRR